MQPDTWKRRLLAPEIRSLRWSNAAPDRLAVVATEGGPTGAWSWDLATGERRFVSGGSVGTEEALVTPDGGGVVWWDDRLGDERGRWLVSSFDGGPPRPLLPDVPEGWSAGISMVGDTVAAGVSTGEDYAVYLASGEGAATVVYRHARPAGVGAEWPQGDGGLSADGRLLCIRHAEQADIAHPSLRVLDSATGRSVGELADPGCTLIPAGWSPLAGDPRLVVIREVADRLRPWLWDLAAGELRELATSLPGDVARAWWYPDATALLLHHEHETRASLLRLDVASGDLSAVAEAGTIDDAGVRPDGEVWYRREDGGSSPTWVAADGRVVVSIPGEPPPGGRRWESRWFTNPAGDRIQAWLLRPAGEPPYPVIVSAHGGPDSHVSDRWDPYAQAYADHGFAVLCPNYRGSTGYGRSFREALVGNIGFPESEDLVAGLDDLVADGIADPRRTVLEGWSWGGYLATLAAGLHPHRWQGVVAGIPVGDLVAAHYECSPQLRAWDEAIMGGNPMTVPGLYHERNPLTYADRVTAPMLLLAGEHDSRCPLGQVMVYAHALRRRGAHVEVEVSPGGHHANHAAERIRQVELVLDFLARCLSGTLVPGNRAGRTGV